MATYEQAPFLVLDNSGNPAPGAVGYFYDRSDSGFTTPLDITDTGGIPIPSVTASDLGVVMGVKTPGPVAVFKSGSMPSFEMVSSQGLLELVNSAVGTTSQAVADVAAYIAANPSALPPGRQPQQILAVDSAGALTWVDPTLATSIDWSNVASRPTTFTPSAHSTQVGELRKGGADTALAAPVANLLDAVDQQAARAAIGAGTGNGTSNLKVGNTAGDAAAWDHTHGASVIAFTPTGSVTATTVQAAIVQAAAMGGSSGSGSGDEYAVYYASGAYPAIPGTAPAGIKRRHFYGPVVYTGATWTGVLDLYTYAPLT